MDALFSVLRMRYRERISSLQEWRLQLLNGILGGILFFWLLALVGGINNALDAYREDQGGLYENPLAVLVSVIVFYVAVTVVVIVAAFNRKLSFNLRAGAFLFMLYALATVGMALTSFSGDGRILFFAFVIFSAILFDLRASLAAFLLTLLTLSVTGYAQVSGMLFVPLEWQANAAVSGAWITGGLVLILLIIAAIMSINYLLQAFEGSLVEARETLKREQRLVQVLRTVSEVNRLTARAKDRQSLLDGVCALLKSGRGYAFAWIGFLGPDGVTLQPGTCAGNYSDKDISGFDLNLTATPPACVDAVLREKRLFQIQSSNRSEICRGCPRSLAYPGRSGVAVPLLYESRALGALVVDYEDPSLVFDEQEIVLLRELADSVAYALVNIEASNRLELYAGHQKFLNDVTQLALGNFDLETLLREFVKSLEGALNADGYYFALWDEARRFPSKFVSSENLRDIPAVIPEDKLFSQAILDAGRILVIPDVIASPYISPLLTEKFNLRSALGIPLVANTQRLGVLVFGYGETRIFSQDELDLAEQASQQFALALLKAKLDDETRVKAAELETLYAAANDMASSLLDPSALLEKLARHMTESLKVTSANIMSVNLANDTMKVVGEYWSEHALPQEIHPDLGRVFENAPYATILNSMVAGNVIEMHFDDTEMMAAEREQFSEFGIKTMLFVPIMAHGQLFGDVELWESRSRREFTASEIRLAQAMAGHAASIIETAELFEQTRKQESELRALLTVSRAISSSLQPFDVLRQAASALARLMRVDFCALSDYLPERGEIVTIAIYSADHDVSEHGDIGRVFLLDEYPATLDALQTGQPLVTRLDDPAAEPSEIGQLKENEMISSLLIPLRLRGQSLGLAEMFTSDPGRVFLPAEIQFASALADQVAIAVENARLYGRLEQREAHFRALIENSAEGVAILSAEGKVIYIAPSYERLSGYPIEEIVGGSAFSHIHPEDMAEVLDVFSTGVATPGAVRTAEYRFQKKNGEWLHFEATGHNMVDDPQIAGIVINYRDVTERKLAEQALEESEARYRTIFQSAGVPIWEDDYSALMKRIDEIKAGGADDFEAYLADHPEFIMEAAGLINVLDVNMAVVELMEAEDKTDLLKPLRVFLSDGETAHFTREVTALAKGMRQFTHESVLHTLRGGRRDVLISITLPPWTTSYERVLISTLDITEWKRAERALQENQERLAGIIATAPNGIITIDKSQKIVLFNPFAEKIFGCSAEYAIGKPLDIFIPQRFRHSHEGNVKNFGSSSVSNRRHGRLDNLYGMRVTGEEFPMEAFISQHTIGEERFFTVIMRDITDRKQAEEALKESEKRFRALAENIPSAVYICLNDERYSMLYLNDSVTDLTGYPKEAFLEQGLSLSDLYHPEDAKNISNVALNPEVNKEAFHITYRIRHKDGDWRWVDEWGTGVLDANGNVQFVEGVMIDITERKRDEETLRRRAEELQSLVIVSSALRSASNVEEILPLVVRYAVEIVAGDFGAIYQLEEPSGHLVSPGWFTAQRGGGIKITGNPSLRHVDGKGITGYVAKTGQIHITENLHEDPLAYILPDEVEILREAHSGISLPLLSQEKVVGVLHIRLRKQHVFSETEIRLLTAIAEMAGNALHRANLYEQTLLQREELARAYDNTLAGWARALELRDELTEGHTRRVTELTLDLARIMGIPEDEIIQIRRGALLHDIGKMGVPDSILNKPGPLTAHEKRIMRMHPQYAFEMLSFIPFLQPALEIPYCHHEWWNGNGYPRGLKGEEIPLSARIFSVIDVWDALTSDRPYRLKWTQEKTLKHIRDGSGKQFDPRVVDAFLKLIEKA
jgi:PAS domain S-box-containing protein